MNCKNCGQPCFYDLHICWWCLHKWLIAPVKDNIKEFQTVIENVKLGQIKKNP